MVSRDIGPDGGTITSADGNLTLTIPEGALPGTETITIAPLAEDELGDEFTDFVDQEGMENAWELGPDGLQFDEPVTATVPSDQTPVQDDATLSVSAQLLLTSEGGQLATLDSLRVDANADDGTATASGELLHFSPLLNIGPGGHVTLVVTDVPDARPQALPPFDVDVALRSSSDAVIDKGPDVRAPIYEDRSEQPIQHRPPPSGGADGIPGREPMDEESGEGVGAEDFSLSPTYDCSSVATGTYAATVDIERVIYLDATGEPRAIDSDGFWLGVQKSVECTSSSFLLAVEPRGDGQGQVTSDPPGIDTSGETGDDGQYDQGTEVTLTAVPDGNSTFAGWGGNVTDLAAENDCLQSPPQGGSCTFIMDRNRDVTATFEQTASEGADLGIGITGPGAPVEPGEAASVTVTVVNDGPEDVANGGLVVATDHGNLAQSTVNEALNCDDVPTQDFGCSFAEVVPAGGVIELMLDFQAETSGTATVTAEVSAAPDDPDPSDDTDETEITVEDSAPAAGSTSSMER